MKLDTDDSDDLFMVKRMGSVGASNETLQSAANAEPMNRTYSKESGLELQKQLATSFNPNGVDDQGAVKSRLSASRRQSRTISTSNHENLPIVQGRVC